MNLSLPIEKFRTKTVTCDISQNNVFTKAENYAYRLQIPIEIQILN